MIPKPQCPIRWTVRVKSITSVINSYLVILQFLQSLAESNKDIASKARGLYNQFSKGEVCLGLRICLELFSETECLSVVLQNKTMMVAGAREKRNENGFNHQWSEMDSKVTPKRLQQSTYAVPDYKFTSPEELYRKVYFKALDSITGEIQRPDLFSGAGTISLLSSGHTCHICNSRTFFLHTLNAEKLPANDNDTEETELIVYSACVW
ncbi:hypothetical protein PR048_026761 [Dryococelus australis]|uniref:Uncharacterized protein n=1 Tax=Dryococelus australis TaxID=614101 RepID=A0ABQ9GMA7_9NEOP|nr:hypothetical protein PR048_026761 [Dryococelus australis]